MVFQNQSLTIQCGEPSLNEIQVVALVASVEFVPNDSVPKVGKVDANLMLATCMRPDLKQGKIPTIPRKCLKPTPFGSGRRTVGPDTIFDGNRALLILAQRKVNHHRRLSDMAVNNCEITLFNLARLPIPAQFERGLGGFRNQNQAAGLPIEAIDEMRMDRFTEVNSHTANQAGERTALGRMADQIRRLVNHQQMLVFVHDVEQVGHCQGASPRKACHPRAVAYHGSP